MCELSISSVLKIGSDRILCNHLWLQIYCAFWIQGTMAASGHIKLWRPFGHNKLWRSPAKRTVAASGHNELWRSPATTNCGGLRPQRTVVASGQNKLLQPPAIKKTVAASSHSNIWRPLAVNTIFSHFQLFRNCGKKRIFILVFRLPGLYYKF